MDQLSFNTYIICKSHTLFKATPIDCCFMFFQCQPAMVSIFYGQVEVVLTVITNTWTENKASIVATSS